jgi:hypothetical protein
MTPDLLYEARGKTWESGKALVIIPSIIDGVLDRDWTLN